MLFLPPIHFGMIALLIIKEKTKWSMKKCCRVASCMAGCQPVQGGIYEGTDILGHVPYPTLPQEKNYNIDLRDILEVQGLVLDLPSQILLC